MGGRLHTAYVRASGAVRVTKQVGSGLNKAISQAVREGRLIEDNPLHESGITDDEALQRAALGLLGLKRLTENVKSRFIAVQSIR